MERIEDHVMFEEKVNSILQELPELEIYNHRSARRYNEIYNYIRSYAYGKELWNTCISLQLVRGLLFSEDESMMKDDGILSDIHYIHCLSVTRMLIDLHPDVSANEEDIALSAALCHVLLQKIDFKDGGKELYTKYHLDPQVYQIIKINMRNHRWKDDRLISYYHTIQENKIALLVKLADRGNIVEQLYDSSVFEAQKYIHNTKKYFFPMCIYGKEHYPELYYVITILMEKMRSLIDVTDILSTRYLKRESELHNEILALKEDNSRIKTIIEQLKKEEA